MGMGMGMGRATQQPLNAWGCECDVAHDIDVALLHAGQRRLDFIITDFSPRAWQTGTSSSNAVLLPCSATFWGPGDAGRPAAGFDTPCRDAAESRRWTPPKAHKGGHAALVEAAPQAARLVIGRSAAAAGAESQTGDGQPRQG
jgi:hypothetical protein